MNTLFSIVVVLSTVFLLIASPGLFLPTVIESVSNSSVLCCSLIATYAIWLGLMNVWEKSGVSRAVSTAIRPLAKRLFLTEDMQTLDCISMNLSVNLLGISGAATPYGIEAVKRLDKSPHAEFSSAMFFVLNATSLQLIPTSVIGVRTALGSVAPAAIILPSLLSSLCSTALGVAFVYCLIPPKKLQTKKRKITSSLKGKNHKIQGTGI